jgi:hypothetical protein
MDAEEPQLRAPAGMFRVIGFALRDGQKYMIGDFNTKEDAGECAKKHGMVGNPVDVYNDRADLVVRYGSRQ